ncbi:MAG: DUF427 domain-containing protein [Myxococcota bacterium]
MTDHINVDPYPRRVVVRFGGEVIVDTQSAVALKEGRIPPRLYFPRADAKMDHLQRTEHSTHCPYKGDAAYYSLKVGDATAANAVWTYEQPIAKMEGIAGMLSFYPQHVEIEEYD